MHAGGQRRRRATPGQRRQAAVAAEDAEEEVNPENPYQVSHATKVARFSSVRCVRPPRGLRGCPLGSEGAT